jgi:lipid II:glycine glycyltransferase (peptidoglycan interpeptide bridge formation enzyme)
MADTEIAVVAQDPDTLVTEIERTRDSLARTIDAIADRVSPANNARRAMERVREQASKIDVRYAAAAGAVVIGAAALLIWRRRK